MSLDILLASGNAHKAHEFAELFDARWIRITAASEKLDVIEDGATFNENALKKAKAYFDKFDRPVMSDDSGLVVNALPGELGIHSARFGGDDLNARQRNKLVLEKMKDVTESDRSAYFICVLCFYLSEKEVFFFEGRMNGKISHSIEGEQGFGYDPIFIPEGAEQTVATMPQWKQENSHRSIACRFAQKFFEERNRQN